MSPAPRNPVSGVSDGFRQWFDRIGEDGLWRGLFWRWLTAIFGRRVVSRKLIDGEDVIAIVQHSWVAYVVPMLLGLVGVVLGVLWLPRVGVNVAWFAIAIVVGILGYSFYRVLLVSRDRFVITDSRVFRVWGVFSLEEAEMEIIRVLDITVQRPWHLRLVGSGNLVLENAAQEQGLRDIRLIPQAPELAMAIHRRRRKMMGLGGDEESGTAPQAVKRPRPQHPRKPGPVTARRRIS